MEEIKDVIKKKWYVGVILLLAILVGFFYYSSDAKGQPRDAIVEISDFEDEEKTVEETQEVLMYVDIKGAVKMPGMYEVSSDMRFLNVIDLAGGLLEEADSQRVNFSQKVEDQMVIVIPKVGEELDEIVAVSNQGNSTEEATSKVNINQATKEELMTLNGVGEKKAEKIIDYREEHGSFQTIEELKKVNGFGEKSFDSLAEYITI